MSNPIRPTLLLRRVLFADAIVSAVVGAVMALGANALQELLGLPSSLLMLAGVALLPYAAYLVWAATRQALPRAAVWVPIVLNVVWAADCAFVLLGGRFSPTWFCATFIGVQIVTVLLFAELELIGLKRACAIVPA